MFREDLKSNQSCHFLPYNMVINLNTTLEHFSGTGGIGVSGGSSGGRGYMYVVG